MKKEETNTKTKVYTIYEVKEIQTKDGQTTYQLTNKWDTTNRNELADYIETQVKNVNRYTSTYNEEKDTYNINATKQGYTFFIDYE